MAVSFNGYNETLVTFQAGTGTKKGIPVKLNADREVAACAANNLFCGKCVAVSGGYASVQLTGYVKLPYTGTAPAVGYTMLAADGSGAVKTVASGGRTHLVIDVDTAANLVGLIL